MSGPIPLTGSMWYMISSADEKAGYQAVLITENARQKWHCIGIPRNTFSGRLVSASRLRLL